MTLETVARYYSHWDLSDHDGRIALYDPSNNTLDNREYTDPEEFQGYCGYAT